MLLRDASPSTIIAALVILLVSFPIHEFAHAWSATRFGDPTPDQYGRLTLNPFAHLDPMGSILLLLAGFGWAKPVPVNPYVLRRRMPSALMWVSLAGPMSNFMLALLGAIPFRLGLFSLDSAFIDTGWWPNPDKVFMYFVYINLLLMLFNLIPLAPLDGDKIVEYFLPPNIAVYFERIRPYGPMILFGLIALGNLGNVDVIGAIIDPPMRLLLRLLLV